MSDAEETPWQSLAESALPSPEAAGLSLGRRHVVLLVVGTLLVVGAVVGAIAPALVGRIELPSLVVFLVALVGLAIASRVGFWRIRRGERGTSFTLVETRGDVERPGADIDGYLREATGSSPGESVSDYRVSTGHHARKMVRRRIADVAVRVLRHRDRVDEETARRALDEGAWTADEAARTLLEDRPEEAADGTAADDGRGAADEDELAGEPGGADGVGTSAPAATDVASPAGRASQAAPGDPPPGYEVESEAEDGDAARPAADDASPVTPCPSVPSVSESNLAARVTDLFGGAIDFLTATRRATGSLAAAVPGVEPGGLAAGSRLVDAEVDDWREGVWVTEHWRGVGAIGLLLVSLATLAEAPTLALVATVFVGFAGYAWVFDPPEPDLAVERTSDPPEPTPGERVTVTVTVTNEGDSLLQDCRLVDQVPDRLAVVGGSARHATAIAAGETATYSYEVLAVAGAHDFADLAVAARDPSGQRERSTTVEGEETTLTCEPAPVTESVPLHPQASGVVGRVPADVGGSGTAFHTVREYRRGDPLDRIDWNRKARTGELGTLQFDEEHAATVLVVVDVRPAASLAPGPGQRSAIDRGLGGASRLVETLLADGDRVGLATMSLEWEYHRPGTGEPHRLEMQELLAREEMQESTAVGYSYNPGRYREQLKRQLPNEAQVVLCSPLCDEEAVDLARWLHARGHSVTVFSPDPTGTGTVGGTLAAIDRTLNLSRLRSAGVRVVDWPPDDAVQAAVERARGRWSA